MDELNNGSPGTPGRLATATQPGPKHLQHDTTEKLLTFERMLLKAVHPDLAPTYIATLRALLRMAECDAQLAQMEIDHAQVKGLLGNLRGVLVEDIGTAQSVYANTIKPRRDNGSTDEF